MIRMSIGCRSSHGRLMVHPTGWPIARFVPPLPMGGRYFQAISHGALHLMLMGGRLSHGISYNPRDVP